MNIYFFLNLFFTCFLICFEFTDRLTTFSIFKKEKIFRFRTFRGIAGKMFLTRRIDDTN